MKYVFASVFATEMHQYLGLMQASGKYIAKTQSSLRNLDRYLAGIGQEDKTLNVETVSAWLKMREVSSVTKLQDCVHIKGFCKYLSSLGIEAVCPEKPKLKSDYVPYIFSDDEFRRIIIAADNFEIDHVMTRSVVIYPILLRLLYGCGLRLGEGRNLRWSDVDLDAGVLTIWSAKKSKQRFVPMDLSLTDILRSYHDMVCREGICIEYLFESRRKSGSPLRSNTFYRWFAEILQKSGISFTKRNRTQRGPCPHCLRHMFTKKSFLKSEAEGRRFEDTAPFLEAYLGHNSIMETEAYLRSSYSVYEQSHRNVNAAIGELFPEVNFEKD